MMASTSMTAAAGVFAAQPDAVADRVLRRAELGKMARLIQNRLALAQFKTRHGWEDLTLDMIEPKVEEEIRRKRGTDGDGHSDSSSNTSDLPYATNRMLMSSPLKPPLFSDAVGSSNGSTGHRKRTYVASFDDLHNDPNRLAAYPFSSPSKRLRSSPPPPMSRHVSGPPALASTTTSAHHHHHSHRAYLPPQQQPPLGSHVSWKDHHQLAHSSPIKPRRQQHFTTEAGPDVSLFPGTRRIADALTLPNYAAVQSDDDDELLPTHSFQVGVGGSSSRSSMSIAPSATTITAPMGVFGGSSRSHISRSGSPPSTPPMRSRTLAGSRTHHGGGRTGTMNDENFAYGHAGLSNGEHGGAKSGVEGADLLLYLASSPTPANSGSRSRLDPPSTPPSKFNSLSALPSSMMTTPGGGSLFPTTPGQAFDFADFVNITPSPAQKPWKTPNLLGSKTPLSVARRRLTFDDPL